MFHIIGAGKNGAHHHTSDTALKDGDAVVADLRSATATSDITLRRFWESDARISKNSPNR